MKKTIALGLLLLALRAWGEPIAGSLDVHWNEGAENCAKVSTLVPLQVHQYEPQTYIIRQGLCVDFEAPLMYLLIGTDEALLLVLHTHGHHDHRAADAQFAALPGVKVVPPEVADLRTALSLPRWPEGRANIALGGRTVDVIAAPGHQPAHLIFYDDRTALLFTGDFLLPGRLMVDDLDAYRASAARLVSFLGDRPVSHVLGAHVELDTAGKLYQSGSQHHPNERALPLDKADVLALPAALADFNGFYARHDHFVITNPKRNLLTLVTGVLLLAVTIVWGWIRARRRKQS
jgi:hydroxyacylglutathione hydrolase